jgi:hypothetical protein
MIFYNAYYAYKITYLPEKGVHFLEIYEYGKDGVVQEVHNIAAKDNYSAVSWAEGWIELATNRRYYLVVLDDLPM